MIIHELTLKLPFPEKTHELKPKTGIKTQLVPVWPPQVSLPISELELLDANVDLNLNIEEELPLSLGFKGLNLIPDLEKLEYMEHAFKSKKI